MIEEVEKRLAPLESKVDRVTNTLRSLYSNGSGGPPGFLENARAEDKIKIDSMVEMKQEEIERLKSVESTLRDHEVARAAEAMTIATQVTTSEKRFNRRLALATLFIALVELWSHRDTIFKTLNDMPPNPAVHLQATPPQDAGGPTGHY